MKISSIFVGIASLAMATGVASAQDAPSAVEQILACQSIAGAAEKLACFETAATAMEGEQTAPAPDADSATATSASAQLQNVETTVAAASGAEPTEPERRRILPSWIPTVTIGRSEKGEPEPSVIAVSVTRIQRNKIGRHYFTTAEGHVWEQIRPGDIRGPKSLPADASLRRLMSGSIRLGFSGTNRSYPVKRIE